MSTEVATYDESLELTAADIAEGSRRELNRAEVSMIFGMCFDSSPQANFVKHASSHRAEYRIWQSMISRCLNPKNKSFKNYGGRGIGVYQVWRESFLEFFRYMDVRPSSKHSLDRIDVNGHYVPGNVRWATASEQARNKRNNVRVMYRGKESLAINLAGLTGIPCDTLLRRLRDGWDIERALHTPFRERRTRT